MIGRARVTLTIYCLSAIGPFLPYQQFEADWLTAVWQSGSLLFSLSLHPLSNMAWQFLASSLRPANGLTRPLIRLHHSRSRTFLPYNKHDTRPLANCLPHFHFICLLRFLTERDPLSLFFLPRLFLLVRYKPFLFNGRDFYMRRRQSPHCGLFKLRKFSRHYDLIFFISV